MHRRDLFRSSLASAAAVLGTGTTVEAIPAPPAASALPALIVLSVPGAISQEQWEQLKQHFATALTRTHWAGIPYLVLSCGMRVDFYDAEGQRLNEPIAVPKRRRRSKVRTAEAD